MLDSESLSFTNHDSINLRVIHEGWQYVRSPKIRISNFSDLIGIKELTESKIQLNEKIREIEMGLSGLSVKDHKMLIQNPLDLTIAKLTGQIESFKEKIKNVYETSKNASVRLTIKNDCLRITIREINTKIEFKETETQLMKRSCDKVIQRLTKAQFGDQNQLEMDTLRDKLNHTENDYLQSKMLLKEMLKVGMVQPDPIVSEFYNQVNAKMEDSKLKLERARYDVFKKNIQLARMRKEICVLISLLKAAAKLKVLYEKKIQMKLFQSDRLQSQLKKLSTRISHDVKLGQSLQDSRSKSVLTSYDTLTVNSQLTESNGQFLQNSIVRYDDKIEFLQERLTAISKEISVEKQNKNKIQQEYENVTKEMPQFTALKSELERSLIIRKNLCEQLQQEVLLTKTYYNQIEEMKGKIRVFCRCRPLTQDEILKKSKICLSFPDEFSITLISATRENVTKEFTFDKVFTPASTQQQVFDHTVPLFKSAFDGFNICIFVYGQTGSGKTFTLVGDFDNNPGIVPRSFEKIFQIKAERIVTSSIEVKCSILELYNDRLLDLLSADVVQSKLEIKKDSQGLVMVVGAEIMPATSSKQLTEIFMKGNSTRHIAATKMNSESSRSHLIITILLTCFLKHSDKITKGKISLIDLAGSEKCTKSGLEGVQAQEGMSINVSLSALGDVISALTTGKVYIPYRNNKLTMLMQDSLGGTAKTLMFVNVSPSCDNALESQNSLTYGARVKLIKNYASKMFDSEELVKLQNIVDSLLKGKSVIF